MAQTGEVLRSAKEFFAPYSDFLAFRGGGWGAGVLGVLGILFGFILVINPLLGVAALPFVLRIFMLVGGVVAAVRAFRMR